MNKFEEITDLLIKYLEKSISPLNTWDICITYILPFISSLILIGSAIAGVIKYYNTKNREIYEKVLSSVYAPLYQYFVKQELFCKIHLPDRDYKKEPIIEVTNTKTKEKFNLTNREFNKATETSTVLNLSRHEFIKVKNSINVGLASQELVTLLNMYEVLIYMEENYSKTHEEYLEATIFKVEVENAIRKEVFQGYKKYYAKLNLRSITKSNYWEVNNEQILFNYKIDEKEKAELRQQIISNPQSYK